MTDNKIRLTELYRGSQPGRPTADALVRYVDGDLSAAETSELTAQLDSAPELAALAALLGELAPASATLAAAVGTPAVAHRRHSRRAATHAVGHHAGRRHHGMRWLSAAAVLALSLGLWGWHHVEVGHGAPVQAAAPASHSEGDAIFGAGMDGHRVASNADEIFRASFNQKS
ncbi:MAG TPA: hypothetical protein VFN09_08415 [Rhodanobacteraceae bacterium]|nr:hypothetical protein [Rhodanobacteraceae bacterium]